MLEKILTPLYVKKKNSITRRLGKVKSLPKPNPPYRPPPPSPLPPLPPPPSLLPLNDSFLTGLREEHSNR